MSFRQTKKCQDLKTSFFNTDIHTSKYFTHLIKEALTSFWNFLYSELPMVSLPLAYCLVIIPINIMSKSFNTPGFSRSILCTSSDYEITSGRINLESSESYKRKVDIWINTIYVNQWFLSLQKGIKTIKYWNYRLDEHRIQLV